VQLLQAGAADILEVRFTNSVTEFLCVEEEKAKHSWDGGFAARGAERLGFPLTNFRAKPSSL
jgi:hypothetical protein